MIIKFDLSVDDADLEEDFDTDDMARESPERVARAFAKLIEMHEETQAFESRRFDEMLACGVTFTVPAARLVVFDRKRAVATFTRLLAEVDKDHPA
jgi:hypothetical protein